MTELSLGAQTMVAWVIDLAWRLHTRFPKSDNPFGESAIMLIDEVEFHLHPKWQRSLREQLLHHFPRIQFIVSTHAPVTAQEAIANGDPVSIVRWTGDHAEIVADPFPPLPVRLDEVATGAFELLFAQGLRRFACGTSQPDPARRTFRCGKIPARRARRARRGPPKRRAGVRARD